MPQTVDARVLLGWMDRREVLKTLLEEAVFPEPLTEQAALQLWEKYKAKVAALGARPAPAPTFEKLVFKEQWARDKFMKKFKKRQATNIRGVVKLNPMGLVIHQLQVILDQSNKYLEAMRSPAKRINVCLGVGMEHAEVCETHNEGDIIKIKIPHSEFQIDIGPNKRIELQEYTRHIALTQFNGRILLWAGYHRTYALRSQEYPEEMDRLLLATLTTDAERLLADVSDFPGKRDSVRGACPPVFGDFFDDGLCMSIKLRKRRCELHIKTTTMKIEKVWLDDET